MKVNQDNREFTKLFILLLTKVGPKRMLTLTLALGRNQRDIVIIVWSGVGFHTCIELIVHRFLPFLPPKSSTHAVYRRSKLYQIPSNPAPESGSDRKTVCNQILPVSVD